MRKVWYSLKLFLFFLLGHQFTDLLYQVYIYAVLPPIKHNGVTLNHRRSECHVGNIFIEGIPCWHAINYHNAFTIYAINRHDEPDNNPCAMHIYFQMQCKGKASTLGTIQADIQHCIQKDWIFRSQRKYNLVLLHRQPQSSSHAGSFHYKGEQ